MFLGFGVFGILGTAFWLLMLYDCIQSGGGKRSTWLWLLVFLNVLGAVLYFFAEWLPNHEIPLPRFTARWTRRQEVFRAEAAARNIGKAHQYVELGTLLLEVRLPERAIVAFQTAREKEPDNPKALWGLAEACVACGRLDVAREPLERLVRLDPEYRRGDAALAYADILIAQDDWERAYSVLQAAHQQFPLPPICLRLAEAEVRAGNSAIARELLEKMLARLRGTYTFSYRRNLPTIRKAEKLLKRIERAGTPVESS